MDFGLPPRPPDSYNRGSNAYTKIKYNNVNDIRDINNKSVFDNTEIFYKDDSGNYIPLGKLSQITRKGHADQMIMNGIPTNMRDSADKLYIRSGGYKKHKTFRKKSKKMNKRKTNKRKTKRNKRITKYKNRR
jgi:hypothetical protein